MAEIRLLHTRTVSVRPGARKATVIGRAFEVTLSSPLDPACWSKVLGKAMKRSLEILIIGAGIIGLTVARALHRRGYKDICVPEKEVELGRHASGRNSGVLHAGVYYATNSLKAKFCATGSKLIQDYATEHGIPLRKIGKVIAEPTPEQLPPIEILFNRAKENGARVEKIDANQLKEIEPEARTNEVALLSPETAAIDASGVLRTLHRELQSIGISRFSSQSKYAGCILIGKRLSPAMCYRHSDRDLRNPEARDDKERVAAAVAGRAVHVNWRAAG